MKVILHGLGQSPESWKTVCEGLEATGEKVLVVDFRKVSSESDCDYHSLYRYLVSLCETFSEKFDLIGLSLGGVLTLDYATHFPEKINSLVLINAQYKPSKFLLRFQNMLIRFIPDKQFQQLGLSKAIVMRVIKSMENLDLSQKIGQITCPTLVINGAKDRPNRKAAIQLSQKITGAKLLVIEGAGHRINEEKPSDLVQSLKLFDQSL